MDYKTIIASAMALALSTGCASGIVVKTTTADKYDGYKKLEDNTTLCSIDSDLDGKKDYFTRSSHDSSNHLIKKEHFRKYPGQAHKVEEFYWFNNRLVEEVVVENGITQGYTYLNEELVKYSVDRNSDGNPEDVFMFAAGRMWHTYDPNSTGKPIWKSEFDEQKKLVGRKPDTINDGKLDPYYEEE